MILPTKQVSKAQKPSGIPLQETLVGEKNGRSAGMMLPIALMPVKNRKNEFTNFNYQTNSAMFIS